MRIKFLPRTGARARIQVYPAYGTQTFAVYPAKDFHRKGQQNLLAQDVCNSQLRSCEERRSRIFFIQLDLFVLVEHLFVALAKEEVKRLADRNPRRFQT